jgi:hypothetical protein
MNFLQKAFPALLAVFWLFPRASSFQDYYDQRMGVYGKTHRTGDLRDKRRRPKLVAADVELTKGLIEASDSLFERVIHSTPYVACLFYKSHQAHILEQKIEFAKTSA